MIGTPMYILDYRLLWSLYTKSIFIFNGIEQPYLINCGMHVIDSKKTLMIIKFKLYL